MEPITTLTFLTGFGLLLMGYLVSTERVLRIFHDNGKTRGVETAGFSHWVGYNLIVTGILGLIDGLFQYLFPVTHVGMAVAYFIIIVPIMAGKMVLGMRRFDSLVQSGGN